jgi:hypothetical protein
MAVKDVPCGVADAGKTAPLMLWTSLAGAAGALVNARLTVLVTARTSTKDLVLNQPLKAGMLVTDCMVIRPRTGIAPLP